MMSEQILPSKEAFKKKINLNDQPLPIKENLEPLINDYFTKFEDNILKKKNRKKRIIRFYCRINRFNSR